MIDTTELMWVEHPANDRCPRYWIADLAAEQPGHDNLVIYDDPDGRLFLHATIAGVRAGVKTTMPLEQAKEHILALLLPEFFRASAAIQELVVKANVRT